jgi:hypothetical protein
MRSHSTRGIGLSLALALVGGLGATTQAQGAGLTLPAAPGSLPVQAPLSTPAPAPAQKPPESSSASPRAQSAPATPAQSPPAPVPITPPGSVSVTPSPPALKASLGGHSLQVSPPIASRGTPAASATPKGTAAPSEAAYSGGASNLATATARRGGGSGGGFHTKVRLRPPALANHADASSLASGARITTPAPGHPRQGPPPSGGGQTPAASAPGGARPGPPLAPLARHGVMPQSPAPNPLAGLRLQPESGEAMQLVLITLAAMLLLGLLFHEELKLGGRARQLVDRITQRPHG